MVYNPFCFMLLECQKKEVYFAMYFLVQDNSVLLERISWIARVYHYELFRDSCIIFFHMYSMNNMLVLVYYGYIVYGHFILCVDYMISVVFRDNYWWPWVLPVNTNFFMGCFHVYSVMHTL